jgi:hypothetical protein
VLHTASVADLPVTLLGEQIIQPSAGDFDDIRQSRRVASAFNDAASLLVCTLICTHSYDISSNNWTRFPRADGLHIDHSSEQCIWPRSPTIQDMLGRVPAGRLKRFFFNSGHPRSPGVARCSEICPCAEAAASAAATCANTQLLTKIYVGDISTQQADMFLTSLPHLEEAHFRVSVGTLRAWALAGSSSIKDLTLELATIPASTSDLDLVNIGHSSKGLQRLKLHIHPNAPDWVMNWMPVSSLNNLERVVLDGAYTSRAGPLEVLCRLPNLWRLDLGPMVVDSDDDWQRVASMKNLKELTCSRCCLLMHIDAE